MSVLSKARELGELIVESPEMQTLKIAEVAIEKDEKAKELLNDFKNLQMDLMKATKEKKNNVDEIKTEILLKQDEINEYEVTKNFFIAKNNFDGLMKQINNVILMAITGEEPCSSDGCSSCGSGGGCCQ